MDNVLRTPRLILVPLLPLHEAEHAQASGCTADAIRDTQASELQWQEHGFAPWAIRDREDDSFLGGAELRFAGDGIEGIASDEIEAGWWVTEERRNEGIATEAMRAAIEDLWNRTDADYGDGLHRRRQRAVAPPCSPTWIHRAWSRSWSLRRANDGVPSSPTNSITLTARGAAHSTQPDF